MPLPLPQVEVGTPVRYQSLTVFPLFVQDAGSVDYQLADEAIGASTLVVQEVGEQGTVPELLVENSGDSRVLFLEGEELRGAKQNRVLNTSVLVAAKSKTRIPVSCVEQGRWRYAGRYFQTAKTRSPSSVLYNLKSSVTRSLQNSGSHASDQGTVWADVAKTQAGFGHCSATRALSDTYLSLSDELTEFQQQLEYPEGAAGLAVAVGGKVVSVDLFDKPATCRKAWDRLLSGFIIDALSCKVEGQADPTAVERTLHESLTATWDEVKPIGEGQEFRTQFNGRQGSALTLTGALVHMNVLSAPAQ